MTLIPKTAASAHPTEFNIAAIAKLEEDALSGRSLTERASDAITRSAGSFVFLALHLTFIFVWVSINLGFVHGENHLTRFRLAFCQWSFRPRPSS